MRVSDFNNNLNNLISSLSSSNTTELERLNREATKGQPILSIMSNAIRGFNTRALTIMVLAELRKSVQSSFGSESGDNILAVLISGRVLEINPELFVSIITTIRAKISEKISSDSSRNYEEYAKKVAEYVVSKMELKRD